MPTHLVERSVGKGNLKFKDVAYCNIRSQCDIVWNHAVTCRDYTEGPLLTDADLLHDVDVNGICDRPGVFVFVWQCVSKKLKTRWRQIVLLVIKFHDSCVIEGRIVTGKREHRISVACLDLSELQEDDGAFRDDRVDHEAAQHHDEYGAEG